jgi:hypothetical protein
MSLSVNLGFGGKNCVQALLKEELGGMANEGGQREETEDLIGSSNTHS